jgi:acyl-CoA hydrolase
MTIHAETAKAIRKELKQAFPLVKFKVNSDSFAGGNSVHIEWDNGPTSDQVEHIVNKYQYGHFDGMQDLYEHTNRRKDIPQVKYVQVRRNVSEDIKQKVFEKLQKTYAHFDKVSSIDESHKDLMIHWSEWTARDFIYRILVKIDLTNGYKEEECLQ